MFTIFRFFLLYNRWKIDLYTESTLSNGKCCDANFRVTIIFKYLVLKKLKFQRWDDKKPFIREILFGQTLTWLLSCDNVNTKERKSSIISPFTLKTFYCKLSLLFDFAYIIIEWYSDLMKDKRKITISWQNIKIHALTKTL